MARKKLPETNNPTPRQTRQKAQERGDEIMSERFPAVQNIMNRSKDTLSKRFFELETKKTKERGYKQIQRNLGSLDNMTMLAEEQNILLREIIRALGDGEGPAPTRRGGRGFRGRVPRKPGRGRYGRAARARLQRMQTLQRQRQRAVPPGEPRPRTPTADAERARPPAPVAERRTQPAAPRATPAADAAARQNADRIITNATESANKIVTEAEQRARAVTAEAEDRARTTTATAEDASRRTLAEAEDRAKVQIQEANERARTVIAQADEAARNNAQEAESIKNRAAAEAESIRNRAHAEAFSTRSRVQYEVDLLRNQAQSDADTIRNRAQTEAETIRSNAQREADSIRSAAQQAAEAQRSAPAPAAEPERVAAPAPAPERTVAVETPVAERVPAPAPAPTTQPAGGRVTAGAGRAGALGAGVGGVVGQTTGQGAGAAAAAGAQAAVATVVISQAAEQTIKATATRFIGRAVLTKVPLAGLLAGIWFSAERAAAGDWVGSGLELTSGVAGTLGAVTFGLGTGASIAIDIGLLTRDIYRALYGNFPEEEQDTELRNSRLAAIGPALTKALNEIISDAPKPQTPPVNNETREKLLGLYRQLENNEEMYNQVGPDVVAGLAALLRQNVQGEGVQQRRAREGMARTLARLEAIIAPRSDAAARMVEIPVQESPAAPEEPQAQAAERIETDSLVTNLSAAYDTEETGPPKDANDTDRIAAEPITRSLLREEDVESALPYPENLIEMIGRTEFQGIEIEADKITFEGEIKLSSNQVGQPQATPNYTPPAAPAETPGPQVTQTQAAPVAMTGGSAPADTGATASPVTPVALPSPAATGIAPAAQPQAAPAPQQSLPVPQEGTQGGGDFMSRVNEVSSRLGINPANLLAVMRSESSLNPRAVNSSTGASGLIQFMPRTAQSLGTSVEAIRQMSAAEQMPYVERFFRSVRLPAGASAGKLYAYVFLPGRANREVLTQSGENFYEANRGLDVDRDGKITIADLDARLMRFGGVGGAGTATMQAAAPAVGGALAAAGTGLAASDQAQARTGSQTLIVQAQNQQAQQAPNVIPQQPSAEVPLNTRLQKQVA